MKPINQADKLFDFFSNIPIIKHYQYKLTNKNKDESNYIMSIELENGETFKIFLKILKNGYPSTIKTQCEEFKSSLKDLYYIVSAPYISESSSNLCEQYNVGYIDYVGNCFFNHASIYIKISGNKNTNISKRGLKSIYERSSIVSSNILRTLFNDLKKPWKLKELSEYVNCSIGQVAKVKNFLAQNDQIEQTESGILLKKPEKILGEWASVYSKKKEETIECYSLDNISDIERKLSDMKKELSIDYYLTCYSGGVRYQPNVRYHKIHVYIDPMDVEKAMNFLGCKEVESGSNISIIVPYDDCIQKDYQIRDGSQVVSPLQIYLDCKNLKGRGEELAEAILEREIVK